MKLHPKKGLNPVLTYCPRCGGDSPELVLVGDSRVYKCQTCGQKMVGPHSESCPNDAHHGKMTYVERYEPEFGERLPASAPCDDCQKQMAEWKGYIEEGGIYWRCVDCKQGGIIKRSPFTERARAQLGVQPPKPCGVEFTKKDCPACGPKEDGDGTSDGK